MSLFEPDPPDPPAASRSPLAGRLPLPAVQAPRRTPWGWLLASSAVTLAVGLVLGFALGSARSGGKPVGSRAGATVARPPATAPASTPEPTAATVRSVATPACLETAARGDEIIDLFVRDRRGRASELLGAYTIASRQCRRDASP